LALPRKCRAIDVSPKTSRGRRDIAIGAQPGDADADGGFGPPEPFSPQADFMTQPVSSGARWLHGDASCTESSRAESETFTCDATHEAACVAERAHRAAAAAPHADEPDGRRAQEEPPLIAVPFGLDFCRRADTVVEGFLCNEPVVVSNACRKPSNAFDEFVCDEPRMKRLQWAILRETWAIVKSIGLSLLRGKR
jgi:hypothetical protein